jgi:hypothetical protein
LADPGVKARWLALGCLVVQASVILLPMPGVGGFVLLVAALATLVGIARANASLAGVPLLALGLLLNLIVVLANVGMPVTTATLERAGIRVEQPAPHRPDAKHVLDTGDARLRVLGDRLAVRPLRTVTSYGTIIELAGLFLLLQYLVRGPGPSRREDETAHVVHEARTVPWTTWAE